MQAAVVGLEVAKEQAVIGELAGKWAHRQPDAVLRDRLGCRWADKVLFFSIMTDLELHHQLILQQLQQVFQFSAESFPAWVGLSFHIV